MGKSVAPCENSDGDRGQRRTEGGEGSNREREKEVGKWGGDKGVRWRREDRGQGRRVEVAGVLRPQRSSYGASVFPTSAPQEWRLSFQSEAVSSVKRTPRSPTSYHKLMNAHDGYSLGIITTHEMSVYRPEHFEFQPSMSCSASHKHIVKPCTVCQKDAYVSTPVRIHAAPVPHETADAFGKTLKETDGGALSFVRSQIHTYTHTQPGPYLRHPAPHRFQVSPRDSERRLPQETFP